MLHALKKTTADIRFWLVLFFVLRLFAVNAPPLDAGHNWRQATVTMAARNFFETDPNIFYPRLDIAGEKTGITGMEFPVLNYLIYLVSLVFGYAHWYGRLINLVVSTLGLWYFYRLVKKYFSLKMAFNATFLLTLSIWFTYSRKIMPDTFSVSLVLAALFYGSNYLDRERSLKNLCLYGLLLLLGALSKLPAAYLLILFVPLIMDRQIAPQSKMVFSGVSLLTGAIISAHYFYWVPYLNSHYGFSHFYMGTGFSQGFAEIMGHLGEFSDKFYSEALGYSGFVLFVIGLALAVKQKNKQLLWVFGLGLFAFSIIILKAGFAFYHHSYYIIPFAPFMALVAANVPQSLGNPKWGALILLLFAAEAIPTKNRDFYIDEQSAAMLQLEGTLDKLGTRSDLVLINSGNVPTPMYFAHRRGWIAEAPKLAEEAYVDSLENKGLKYIVVLKRAFGQDVDLGYKKLFDSPDYKIYNLEKQ